MKIRTLSLLTALVLTSNAYAYQAGKTYRYTIIHTNDTHGRFWQNEQGEYGFAAQKTAIDQIRREVAAKGGTVLVLHAGDINTGVPESDLQNARPDIEGMNAMGFDAMTLGNHEFDNPNQLLAMQERWAKFPFLAANVRHKNNGRAWVKPHILLQRGGLKFAIVGLTTPDTAFLGNPDYTKNVLFQPVEQAATRSLSQLSRADVRIALTHLGYDADIALAKTLPAHSFDAIIGGHSHTLGCVDEDGKLLEKYQPTQACQPLQQNGTWVMQAGDWGKYIGRADFEFKDGRSTLVSYQLIPINLKAKYTENGKTEYRNIGTAITPDAALLAKLKVYQDQGSKLLDVNIGRSLGFFDGKRELARSQQIALGQLVARAQLVRTQADISVVNSGNLRDSLPEGELTYKHVLKIQPFGNTISVVALTGKELLDFMQVVVRKEKGAGAYPQFTGMRIQTCGADNTISSLHIKDTPIDVNQNYRLAIASYLAAGGDGYPVLRDKAGYSDTGFVDAEVLKDYITQNSPLQPAQYTPDVWQHSEQCEK